MSPDGPVRRVRARPASAGHGWTGPPRCAGAASGAVAVCPESEAVVVALLETQFEVRDVEGGSRDRDHF